MSDSAVSNDQFVASIIDRGRIGALQVRVIVLCVFFNMLDGFDITAMAVVASAVGNELNLSDDRIGWIFSMALAGMMAGAMLLAPLSDLIGRRRLIIASLGLVGVSIIFTAQADSLAALLALRFISGLGAGAIIASQAALAAEYSPERYRTLAVALVTAGYPLGAMMTSVVAGFLMPEYGWRGMFLAGGAVTVSMALVAAALLPESLKFLAQRQPVGALQRVNRILTQLKQPSIDALPKPHGNASPVQPSFVQTFLQLFAVDYRRTTLRLWLAFFLSFATLYFLMSWIPKLMMAAGFDESIGRFAFFLFNLGGVIGIFLMGLVATRMMLTTLILIMLLTSAIGMLVFALVPAVEPILLALIFMIGVMQQGGFTGLYGIAAKAYPTSMRSTGIGWAVGLGRSGAVVGPAVAGYLIAFGFDLSANFLVFAVPLSVAAVLAYSLKIR
ncbi:MAG: MFS transporter [Pseudomonadota bacterium]